MRSPIHHHRICHGGTLEIQLSEGRIDDSDLVNDIDDDDRISGPHDALSRSEWPSRMTGLLRLEDEAGRQLRVCLKGFGDS
jgi:hypothetical protein